MKWDFYSGFRVALSGLGAGWFATMVGILVAPYHVHWWKQMVVPTLWSLLPYALLVGCARWIAHKWLLLVSGALLLLSHVYTGIAVMKNASSTAPVLIMLQPAFALVIVFFVLFIALGLRAVEHVNGKER